MSETDTSREMVDTLAQGHDDDDDMHFTADVLRALLARAEKAEAERDTAWNDALDAASDHFQDVDITDELNALKKGSDQ